MALLTFGEIKDMALDLADVTGDPHIDSQMLVKHANFCFAELHALVVGADERYLVKTANFIPVSGQREYALPADFYKSIKIWYNGSDGNRHPMRHMPLDQIDSSNYSLNRRYTIIGQALVLSKDMTETVEMRYVPKFLPMANDSDVCNIAIPEDWLYYVVLKLARYVRQRSDLDTVELTADLQAQRTMIQNIAEDRDTGEADSQTDVYGRQRRSRWWSCY